MRLSLANSERYIGDYFIKVININTQPIVDGEYSKENIILNINNKKI